MMSVPEKRVDLQKNLENELVRLVPLQENDFERLYAVASDPLIWAQHPNKDRYKEEVFRNFFKGAIESGGAYLILDQLSGEVVGSSRYYDYNAGQNQIFIGYTFVGRKFWGQGYNPSFKKLMIDHAFGFTTQVLFHIGAENIRSQKAIQALNAVKIGEQEVTYYGETPKKNFVYRIGKMEWETGL
ncbi:GNAT family N-acetyltransferase [Pedobacter nutrimenti]|uniref:RimJ/RimL family protein N-acetyltransferase n=1 Tax=Pedobacter nutrimenti TaxID=1241337 RepID=A0A318UN39_9SPHI|nr:GNAT family N-acetyltransferase [Pedobacter nutrimenti]PYF77403.1 RimJ/RimL family protein N-acetyltransferase [Pedobacter nutrimenti]